MTLTLFDFFSLVLVIILAVRSAYIGFVTEFFSRVAVIFASLGAVLFYKKLVPKIIEITNNTVFPEILSFLFIFIGLYLVIKLIQNFIGSFFQSESLVNFDHALGFFWGIVEGLLFLSVLLFFLKTQKWIDITSFLKNSLVDYYLTPFIGIGTSYLEEVIPIIQK